MITAEPVAPELAPICLDGIAVARAETSPTLLLAAMDSEAERAMAMALEIADFSFERLGELFFLFEDNAGQSDLRAALAAILPRSLMTRVKAAVLAESGLNRTLASTLLHAEPLPQFFELWDSAWVREALENRWLFSVYHPILDAGTGERFAYEALIRARNPMTSEIVGAGPLIEACRRLNLQHELDQRARIAAIEGATGLNGPHEKFFINFLPGAVLDPAKSLQKTLQAARRCKIDTSQLVFEVVETEQIEDPVALRCILDVYRERGVGIALDDIGSGFSSLQRLNDLQPDFVKIERHLCAAAATVETARHTLHSIVDLSRKLGAKVVAEGIETKLQMEVCVEAGVDYLQGFLFAQPAFPPQAVAAHHFHKSA